MTDVFLGDGSLVGAAFSDAGLVLFGVLLFLYGAVMTTTIQLKSKPTLFRPLVVLLSIQFMLLLGIVAIDLSGIETLRVLGPFAQLSELLSTHRWLIIQLPFILIAVSIISLMTYGERLVEKHAQTYFISTMVSIWLSFAVIVLIGFESML
ncbi:hypothetical protein HZA85_03305 [Candidatus Uhrbacteria bacterium]|nr:hypothetical protein [Candidatus Uhrbacteria bacterium]